MRDDEGINGKEVIHVQWLAHQSIGARLPHAAAQAWGLQMQKQASIEECSELQIIRKWMEQVEQLHETARQILITTGDRNKVAMGLEHFQLLHWELDEKLKYAHMEKETTDRLQLVVRKLHTAAGPRRQKQTATEEISGETQTERGGGGITFLTPRSQKSII